MPWGGLVSSHARNGTNERAEELRNYLEHEIDDNIARGMSPDAAARAAHLKLGNTTLIREEIYEMNTLRFTETIAQDLRYGFRLLRRNPTFSIVAILTLALGTGANAAIFQLVNSVRLRALPVERPHELVSIGIDTNDTGRTGRFMSRRPFFSDPLFQAIRAEQQGFSQVFAWGITTWNLASDGEYRPAQGLYVTGGFFDGLGVKAQIGRVITAGGRQGGMRRAGCRAHPRFLAIQVRWEPVRHWPADNARRPSVRSDRCDAAGVFRSGSRAILRCGDSALRGADDPRGG